MIDDGEPVYGDFKVATTQDVIDAGGESRFTIVIDVTSLTDGETHKIQALAKLENGDIVKLNRNADGKDRDAYVNYKAQLVEEPVTEPTTQETQPQTGDATVAMFAVLAVLALGAAVVFAKKRSF
jgi:LPXTG-motif cell wall-anchored protein